MLILLTLYIVLVWLIFSKLRLLRWGWFSGTVAVVIGTFILVSGQITSIPVQPNAPVAVLFQMDPAPFQYKVNQLEASLVQAKQQAERLKANYEQATANVEGLAKQLAYHSQRLADYQSLVSREAQTQFRLQYTQVQYETVQYQLQAAKAAQLNARLAMDSQIEGINTNVASTQALLENAKWELEQTTVRAPSDGYVTAMALTVGDRALFARSVMSFIVTDEITVIGMFPPNGFDTIKPGASVKLVFDERPGRPRPARSGASPQI